MKGNNFFILIIIVTFLFSCSNNKSKVLNASEYIEWYNSNVEQFVEKKTIGEIDFILTYIPQEYLMAKQIFSKNKVNNEDKNIVTFNLRISTKEGNIQEFALKNYGEMKNQQDYFSYRISDDIYFVTKNFKKPAVHTIYQSGQGLAPFIDFLINFDNSLPSNDFIVQYNDQVWGCGRVNFQLKIDNLKNIPILKI